VVLPTLWSAGIFFFFVSAAMTRNLTSLVSLRFPWRAGDGQACKTVCGKVATETGTCIDATSTLTPGHYIPNSPRKRIRVIMGHRLASADLHRNPCQTDEWGVPKASIRAHALMPVIRPIPIQEDMPF
jgi:hypothetical protein